MNIEQFQQKYKINKSKQRPGNNISTCISNKDYHLLRREYNKLLKTNHNLVAEQQQTKQQTNRIAAEKQTYAISQQTIKEMNAIHCKLCHRYQNTNKEITKLQSIIDVQQKDHMRNIQTIHSLHTTENEEQNAIIEKLEQKLYFSQQSKPLTEKISIIANNIESISELKFAHEIIEKYRCELHEMSTKYYDLLQTKKSHFKNNSLPMKNRAQHSRNISKLLKNNLHSHSCHLLSKSKSNPKNAQFSVMHTLNIKSDSLNKSLQLIHKMMEKELNIKTFEIWQEWLFLLCQHFERKFDQLSNATETELENNQDTSLMAGKETLTTRHPLNITRSFVHHYRKNQSKSLKQDGCNSQKMAKRTYYGLHEPKVIIKHKTKIRTKNKRKRYSKLLSVPISNRKRKRKKRNSKRAKLRKRNFQKKYFTQTNSVRIIKRVPKKNRIMSNRKRIPKYSGKRRILDFI